MSIISYSKLLNPVLGVLTTTGGGSSQQCSAKWRHTAVKVCSVMQWGQIKESYPHPSISMDPQHLSFALLRRSSVEKELNPKFKAYNSEILNCSCSPQISSLLLYQSFQIKPIVCKGKTSKINRKTILTSRDPVVLSCACIHTTFYLYTPGLKTLQ